MKTKLTIDEEGFVHGVDLEDTKKRLFFPVGDALHWVLAAVIAGAKKKHEEGFPINADEPQELSDRVVVVPTGLYDDLIDRLQDLEDEFLVNRKGSCAECKARREDVPEVVACPGIMKKGDVVRNVVGAALRLGLITLLEQVTIELNAGGQSYKESSAYDMFTPALRAILAGEEGNR